MMTEKRVKELLAQIAETTFVTLPADESLLGGMRDNVLCRLMLYRIGRQGSVSAREVKPMIEESNELAVYIDLHEREGTRLDA